MATVVIPDTFDAAIVDGVVFNVDVAQQYRVRGGNYPDGTMVTLQHVYKIRNQANATLRIPTPGGWTYKHTDTFPLEYLAIPSTPSPDKFEVGQTVKVVAKKDSSYTVRVVDGKTATIVRRMSGYLEKYQILVSTGVTRYLYADELAAYCATCGEVTPDGTCPDCAPPMVAGECERAARGFIGGDRDLAEWDAAASEPPCRLCAGTGRIADDIPCLVCDSPATAAQEIVIDGGNVAAFLAGATGGGITNRDRMLVVAEFMTYLMRRGAFIGEYSGGGIEGRRASEIEGFALQELIEGYYAQA